MFVPQVRASARPKGIPYKLLHFQIEGHPRIKGPTLAHLLGCPSNTYRQNEREQALAHFWVALVALSCTLHRPKIICNYYDFSAY
jgi:hypothetical protein